ncbi:hypothetical protein ANCDUO_19236 [Ancylostoma duodenale]|uniref:Reverse transcriptase domain-containing protein n=1 Tax=Ancylostoma duodenale TaxID=51022 RepID=A0A0C2CLK7_9BILA|nr:hypothetical protein ANCDUO_19236 [Ancylostoma duodenale]
MKRNKATGSHDVPADMWNQMGESGAARPSKSSKKMLSKRQTPEIGLPCHTSSFFLGRILDSQLKAIVSATQNHCGFVKVCGTIDAIHAARLFVERHRERNRFVHLAFLDLEKAFDRVPQDSCGCLCECMHM